MSGAGPLVDALRASLLALAQEPADTSPSPGMLDRARQQWAEHCAAFGLVLHGDHDPHVAPGLHVVRPSDPLAIARLRHLARSWEMFDRAFEACSAELEQRLFDERIAPCFLSVGVSLADMDLAQDHLFVIDERYVASLPPERWDQHAARHAAPVERDGERMLRGIRRVVSA